MPTPETHLTRPQSPYGVSKVAAEMYLDCWAGLHAARGVSLRLANVYGPRQNPEGEAGVVAIFTRRLLSGRSCVINGDGEQTRDYVYVGDVADAVTRAVTRAGATGAINVGTSRETTVNEIYTHAGPRGRRGPAGRVRPGPAGRAAPQRARLGAGAAPARVVAPDGRWPTGWPRRSRGPGPTTGAER